MAQRIKQLFPHVFATLTIVAFLVFKLSNLTYRFGDSYTYPTMAKQLLSGVMPYRDFFLADPPFFVLMLTPIVALFGKYPMFVQIVPIVLEAGTAILLYVLARRWKLSLSFLAPLFYLFSFTILATADYSTGLQLTVFLMTLAMLCWEKDKPAISGSVWALACLTKLYAVPAFAGFLIVLMLAKDKRLIRVFVGATAASLLVLGPFLLIDVRHVIAYVITHHFHRPEGHPKITVVGFFLAREWMLLTLGAFGMWIARKSTLQFSFLSLIVFLLIFQDLYYLYFATLLPLLALGGIFAFEYLYKRSDTGRAIAIMLAILYATFLGASFMHYVQQTQLEGRFLNAQEIANAIAVLPEPFALYGSHESAPLLSLLSGRPIAHNFIETNPQGYASKAVDLNRVSTTLAADGVYLVARIADRPEFGLKDSGYEGYFAKEVFVRACSRVLEFPSTSEEIDNHIVVYRCKN